LLYNYIIARKSSFSLKNKKDNIIRCSIEDGHGKAHGLNIIKILERTLDSDQKIKLIDTIDDICKTCNRKNEKACKEFIRYGVSATSADRGELYFYGLKRGAYTSEFIQRRILERGHP
jgi:hypothetical protein